MNCVVLGVAKSWTQLSAFHLHFLSRQGGRDQKRLTEGALKFVMLCMKI